MNPTMLWRRWFTFSSLVVGAAACSAARMSPRAGIPGDAPADRPAAADDPAVGEIVFQRSEGAGNLEIFAVRTDGSSPRRLTASPGYDAEPRWSPDGQRIVFTSDRDATADQRARRDAGAFELYVMNADGSGVRRLTTNDYFDASPAWSPDGRRIAFVATPGVRADSSPAEWAAQRQIFVMDLDGSGVRRLTTSPGGNNFPAWSPDGRRIAFSSGRDQVGGAQVYVMNADGSGQTRLTHSAVEETYPAWSPDGRRIAFISKALDSLSDVHVVDADGSNSRNLTRSAGFDGFPAWSPDGRQIVYAKHEGPGTASSLYVMGLAGAEPPRAVGVVGTRPSWRPVHRRTR